MVFEPAGEKLFPQRKAGIQDQVNCSSVSVSADGPLGVKNIFKCNQQLSGWISGLFYKKKHMPGVVNLAKNVGLLSSQAPWVNS